MRIIAESNLRAFCLQHADVQEQLSAWISEARSADWKSAYDIKTAHRTASILGNNRVCFNIKGNAYRLIVAVDSKTGIALIKFIGTHAEYAKIDADTVDMFGR